MIESFKSVEKSGGGKGGGEMMCEPSRPYVPSSFATTHIFVLFPLVVILTLTLFCFVLFCFVSLSSCEGFSRYFFHGEKERSV